MEAFDNSIYIFASLLDCTLNEKRKKIVYIINHISFFVSHRLDLAKHARNNSYEIFLIAGKEAVKK